MLVVAFAVQWTLLGVIPAVRVVGFLGMLGGAVLAITSVGASGAAPAAKTEPTKNGFTGRMEERFRRRFEQE